MINTSLAIDETRYFMNNKRDSLQKAKSGDIRSFHSLFSKFQPQLKSYLYRLVANRNDMEDLAHDVFILAYENVNSFKGEASLKTWVFTIATNHARQFLIKEKVWHTDTFERTRSLAHKDKDVMKTIDYAHHFASQNVYDIREHIDYCFTCVSKMLPLNQQIALILKDIYGFKVREITEIINQSHGKVKHLLFNSRKRMVDIFDDTCALVNKKGICDQCSGLNGKFNPKQNNQEELMRIKMVNEKNRNDTQKLYALRTELVKSVDPLHANGSDLHEVFMNINQQVNS